jgi:hypothetical protein
LTDEERVAGLIGYSLSKNIVMGYSHVWKLKFGIRPRLKEGKKERWQV